MISELFCRMNMVNFLETRLKAHYRHRRYDGIILIVLIAAFLAACAQVPITGRRQLDLIPSSTLLAMSFQQYDQFLRENELSDNVQQTRMVKEVGENIAGAVERFLKQNDMADHIQGYQWEFHLIASDDVNAWAMPGGKVVIYEGLMPVARDRNGLAVVMGHEIAHAVAEHGSERMSQGLLAQFGSVALAEALRNRPAQTQQLWMVAFGLGAQVGVILPYSRLQESEADRLGLIFMAMAGYDPREAVGFWTRMTEKKGGAGAPEFLSTHPSDQKRIKNIKELIPEAMEYYRPAN
jgi:predicted Zn-dependent protease